MNQLTLMTELKTTVPKDENTGYRTGSFAGKRFVVEAARLFLTLRRRLPSVFTCFHVFIYHLYLLGTVFPKNRKSVPGLKTVHKWELVRYLRPSGLKVRYNVHIVLYRNKDKNLSFKTKFVNPKSIPETLLEFWSPSDCIFSVSPIQQNIRFLGDTIHDLLCSLLSVAYLASLTELSVFSTLCGQWLAVSLIVHYLTGAKQLHFRGICSSVFVVVCRSRDLLNILSKIF